MRCRSSPKLLLSSKRPQAVNSMIPIRDDAPRALTPYVTYSLIALNVLVFIFEASLPHYELNRFIAQFGVIPAQFTRGIDITNIVTLLSSTFLHGGWIHLIANMWALYIFGDNVEDYLGGFKYLLLYLSCGILASLAQIFFNPHSTIPVVGASGAIAGVMGAYFFLFPAARVLTILPIFFVFFLWLPAWVVLGYWFLAQFVNGAATTIAHTSSTAPSMGGIAFWAHVGGFIAGLTLVKVLHPRQERYWYQQ
jgi:membrane associated rhomboid family serine protease